MSKKHDLMNSESVLFWANNAGFDTETAAYIAEAVAFYESGKALTAMEAANERIQENERLRQAFDAGEANCRYMFSMSNDYEEASRYMEQLRNALKEEST